ncbi:MAG: hypothetical protein QM581_05430 [Pseudomonas sp.]
MKHPWTTLRGALLFAAMIPLAATAAAGMPWRLEPAASHREQAPVAADHGEQVLVWQGPGGAQVASVAYLLAEAPFAQVQPAVARALQPQGRLEIDAGRSPLAYQRDGWDKVLLSRRPDLRAALVERDALPYLRQAVAQGAITADEMRQRLALAHASLESAPQDRIEVDAFQQPYAYWLARREDSHGFIGRQKSRLEVYVFDVSAAFGHPATAVRISRNDSYPNPDATLLKQLKNFDILSTSPASRIDGGVVPASVFKAVRGALLALPGPVTVAVADAPQAWIQPPALPPVPALALTAPAADVPALQPEAVPWGALVIGGDPARYAPLYPRELLALPGGDLLVSAELMDDTGPPVRVWRLHAKDGGWQAEDVWRGAGGAATLSLSADGRTVWFDGSAQRDAAPSLIAYDVASRRLDVRRVAWAGGDRDDFKFEGQNWVLDGRQQPAIFTYFTRPYSERTEGDGRFNDFLRVLQPAPAGRWSFAPRFDAPRQSLMQDVRILRGNSLILPVRWRESSAFWIEDPAGIARLDAASGRVLRAIALPQRFGEPNRANATGMAQWVPRALGSPQAGWIATGFVLMLHDGGNAMPPPLDGSAGEVERFVGMHVVDLQSGEVLSALLGRSGTLEAAARSANGRFLALGSQADRSPNVAGESSRGFPLALWEVAQRRTPVRLDTSATRGDAHALAFSWNGEDLWVLGDRQIYRWRLPPALRDAAGQGAFPDQSRN